MTSTGRTAMSVAAELGIHHTLISRRLQRCRHAELLSRRRFASQAEAKMACFSDIEGWYDPVRLHSALGYRFPMTYEATRQEAKADT